MTDAPIPLRPGWHPSLTRGRILEAAQRQIFDTDNPGFCTTCGSEAEGCEPDARHYPCEHCGQSTVFAAEELLIRIAP